MRWHYILIQRLRSLFRARRIDQELDDELRYHLQRQVETLVAGGKTPERARQIAMRDMGGLEQRREECRDTRGVRFLSTARGTLRDAMRALRRRPAVGLVTVVTLAVGIGGGATMLAVVDVLMLRPPAGIVDPDRVVSVPLSRNYVVFSRLRDAAHTIDLAAYFRPAATSLGAGADADSVRLECVTPSYFAVLGTPMRMGRAFSDADTALDTNLTIVLAYHFWQRRFRGDADAIGDMVQLARRTYTIVGIAPPNFRGVEANPVDGWIVLEASPTVCSLSGSNALYSSGGGWLQTFARLRPGMTRDRAVAEVRALAATVAGDDRSGRTENVRLPTLAESASPQAAGDRRMALWLLGGGLAMLLIACANVAGVLAIRAIDRRREFAIRAQLGASRARVVAQVMAESAVLGIFGGATAWILAVGVDRALRAFFPFAPDAGLLDARFFVALGAATTVAGVSSGIAPAIHAARTNIKGTIGLGATRKASRLRHTLLVVQVALALVLASAAGLFARSVANARTGLGYDTDRVVVATIDFERAGYRRQAQIQEFFDRLVERAKETPGVERVAIAANAPLANSSLTMRMIRPRLDPPTPGTPIEDTINVVSAGYFTTLGTRIIRGRDFLESDDASTTPVMVVDEATAARLWPHEDALGKCAYLYPSALCTEIVGVIEQRRHYRLTRPASEFFVPNTQIGVHGLHELPRHLLLRTTTLSDAAVVAIATTLRSATPDMPFVNVQRLDDLVDTQARSWRLGSAMFGFFGAAAIGLAAIGIFAALSFVIRQRTPELGLRLALGATHAQVTWLVGRFALVVLLTGLSLGGIAAFFAARLIETSLFGVTPTDAGAYLSATLALMTVGAAACVLPCLRARRIDPIVALKTE